MLNIYNQITPQSKIDNPILIKLESRKLLMYFLTRPFLG